MRFSSNDLCAKSLNINGLTANLKEPHPSQSLEGLQIIPIAVRVIPFVAFAALTLLQGKFGVTGQYWIMVLRLFWPPWLV